MTYRVVRLGELAHIVGQQDTPQSPRGANPMPMVERDLADNLMLLCGNDHQEIDDAGMVDEFTATWLRNRKRAHEDRIHHLTGLADDRATTIIRMIGNIRNQTVELSRETAAMTVVRSADRFPLFLESYSRHGIEIDLRPLPGEVNAGTDYYQSAISVIDSTMTRVVEGAASGRLTHMSIFGFARLPLLVYLGASVDDTLATDIYQRHRADEAWDWSEGTPDTNFTIASPSEPAVSEAVLALSVSGTIQAHDTPAVLTHLPHYHIGPEGGLAHPDILRNHRSLAAFERTLRELLSRIEQDAKTVTHLHVLPALPVSAAITLGRVHDPQVHPALRIYDRTPGGYRPAIEIAAPQGHEMRTPGSVV